jgi:AAA family ATP:ADP antiporter
MRAVGTIPPRKAPSSAEPGSEPVALAALCVAVLVGQHVAARASRDALFLSTFDASSLPSAMLVAALVGLVTVFGTAQAMARFGPGRVVPLLLVLSGVIHLVEWRLLAASPRAAVVLVYLHVSIAGGVLVSGFWSIVNERFDPHVLRKIAGVLSAGAASGGLLGGLAARVFVTSHGFGAMLGALGATALVAGAGSFRLARGSASAPVPAERELTPSGTGATSGSYLGKMAALVALVGLSSAVVDFAFKTQISSELRSGPELVRFFALFYMVVSVVSVLFQLTLSRFMLSSLGLGAALAALPATVAALGLVGIAVPGAVVLSLLRGSGVVLESSLFRAAYEPLYAPLPLREKRSKKSLIDVACDRIGEVFGSGAILGAAAVAPALGLRAGLGVAVLASLVAVWLSHRLKEGYVAELAHSLKSGRLNLVEDPHGDKTTRLTLSQTQLELDRDALLRQIEELRAGTLPLSLPSAASERAMAFLSGDHERVVQALRAGPLEPELVSLVIPLLEDDHTAEAAVDALRAVAVRVPGQLVDALLDPALPQKLRRRLPRVLRSAPHPRAVRGLAEALLDPEREIRLRAALALRDLAEQHQELRPPQRLLLQAAQRELEADPDRAYEIVFMLLSLSLESEALDLAQRALGSGDPKQRGTALEYLEQVIPEPIRSGIWPYLQAGRPLSKSPARRAADIENELRRSFG